MNGGRVEIPGTTPLPSGNLEKTAVFPGQQLTATILLRRRPGAADAGGQLLAGNFEPISRDAAAEQIGADPQDLHAVESFVREYGLTIASVNPAARTVKVEGTATDFNRAFEIDLGSFGNYVSYSGPITVPESLAGVVVAVLGLDNRPVARPRTGEEANA